MGHRPQLSWGSLTHLEARGRPRQQHLRLPGEWDQVMGWGWLDQVRDPGNHSPYVSLVMTLESHRLRPIFVAQEPMACDL